MEEWIEEEELQREEELPPDDDEEEIIATTDIKTTQVAQSKLSSMIFDEEIDSPILPMSSFKSEDESAKHTDPRNSKKPDPSALVRELQALRAASRSHGKH